MNKKNNLSQSAKVSLDKPIKMPRPYISWSQLSLFERNPIEYASIYLYGDKRTNPRMELGKAVAEMLEKGEENTDKNLEFYRVFLPQYPHKEFDVKAMLGDILLFGKLDGFDDRCSACGQNWLDMVELEDAKCKRTIHQGTRSSGEVEKSGGISIKGQNPLEQREDEIGRAHV